MNCTSRITAAFAAAAFIGATASAADLTVPYGESTNITESVTFDTVIVNGDLVVAQGVTLTCSYFFVSQNNSGHRATVTLQNNAKITMSSWTTGDDNVRCVVGDGSPATLTLNAGSSFTASEMRLARDVSSAASDGQTPVKVVINDATLEPGKLNGRSKWNSGEAFSITLNGSKALLYPNNFNVFGNNQKARIVFNGGLVKIDKWESYGNSPAIRLPNGAQKLTLESVDGNPFRFSFYGGNSGASLFGCVYNNTIETTGSGALQMERFMSTPKPLAKLDRGDSSLVFGHTGGFRILAGANMMLDDRSAAAISVMANGANDLAIEFVGLVDLNGANVSFDDVVSAGTITNTSETAAALTVGANGGDADFGIAPNVPVVKTGAGALHIPDGSVANVSVQGGTLGLCDRASVGYPYYRFWMRAKKSNVSYIGISEFALFDGANEVTSLRTAASHVTQGGYIVGNVTNVLDRDFATAWRDGGLGYTSEGDWRHGNRQDFVIHYGNAPSFESDNGASYAGDHVPDVFPNPAAPSSPSPLQRVTSYTFAYCDAVDDGGLNSTPTEWYFQGAMKGNEWRDLDHVTGYDAAGGTAGAWCGTNFVVKCGVSEVSVDSLTVGDNATWAIDMDQADIDVGTLTAGQNVRIVVSNAERPGASMALPVSVSSLSGNLSTWRIAFAESPNVERGVCLDNGHLATLPEATVILMK